MKDRWKVETDHISWKYRSTSSTETSVLPVTDCQTSFCILLSHPDFPDGDAHSIKDTINQVNNSSHQPTMDFNRGVQYRVRHHPWRPPEREFIQGIGWVTPGGRRLRRAFPTGKPSYAFVWPKDGKRGSKMGRLKDILQNTGPDIHLAIGAERNVRPYNWPTRGRWSRWTDMPQVHMDQGPDFALRAAPWVRPFREEDKKYDFRTRTYKRPDRATWVDALWPEEPNSQYKVPRAYRCMRGNWHDLSVRHGGVPQPGWNF